MSSTTRVGILIEARNASKPAFEETVRDAKTLRQELLQATGDIKAGVPGATERFKDLRKEFNEMVRTQSTLRRSFRESHETFLTFASTARQVGSIGRTVLNTYQDLNLAQIRLGDTNRDVATAQDQLTRATQEYNAALASTDPSRVETATKNLAEAQRDLAKAQAEAKKAADDQNNILFTIATTQIPGMIGQIGSLLPQLEKLRAAFAASATAARALTAATGVGLGLIIGGVALKPAFIAARKLRGESDEEAERQWKAFLEQNPWAQALNIGGMQRGGIVTRPTLAMLGEAGPEAVIPLNRAAARSSSVSIGEVNIYVPPGMDGGRFAEDFLRRLNRMGRP